MAPDCRTARIKHDDSSPVRPAPGNQPGRIRLLIAFVMLLTLAASALSGCSTRPFRPECLLKTTIDMVAEDHASMMNDLMRTLTLKLYRRNPAELAKAPEQTIESRLECLFGEHAPESFGELDNRRSIDAMLLCFDERFSGDRVFALMAGLRDMIGASYGDKDELYFYDSLDPQPLYDSARNIEILVWRLNHRRDVSGHVFLLTDEPCAPEPNLSFERLFGKMIAVQDLLATNIADRTNRTIVSVTYRLASAAFIPVGL